MPPLIRLLLRFAQPLPAAATPLRATRYAMPRLMFIFIVTPPRY